MLQAQGLLMAVKALQLLSRTTLPKGLLALHWWRGCGRAGHATSWHSQVALVQLHVSVMYIAVCCHHSHCTHAGCFPLLLRLLLFLIMRHVRCPAGSFSLQDIHTWLRDVLPDISPHLAPGSSSAGHLFKHCQLGSLLGCQYSSGMAEFLWWARHPQQLSAAKCGTNKHWHA